MYVLFHDVWLFSQLSSLCFTICQYKDNVLTHDAWVFFQFSSLCFEIFQYTLLIRKMLKLVNNSTGQNDYCDGKF